MGANSQTSRSDHINHILEVLREIQVDITSAFEVKEYLLAHSDLGSLIPPICSKLMAAFGEAKLTLKVYRDTEANDEYLTLYIRRNDHNKNFLNSIDEVMLEFETILGSASGWLLVTADLSGRICL